MRSSRIAATSAAAICGRPATSASSLAPDAPGTLVASTESWDTIGALDPVGAADARKQQRRDASDRQRAARAAQPGSAAELVLAADQFIITPAGRIEEAARARAAGDEVRTVIAGYHWFTDWGRDTMISLEGLTLCTGRQREAGYILRTFGHYVRDGLIPNMFPEGTNEGLYHTADATLWFFHAIHRYLARDRRSRDAAAVDAEAEVDLRVPHEGHPIRHRRRSGRRPAAAGRGGISADVDGCEGRRLGRHAAARQGGGDQRALVQRAVAVCRLAARGRRSDGAAGRRSGGPRARILQREVLVRGGRLPLRRHRRRARRRSGVPAEPDLRDLARPSRSSTRRGGVPSSTWCASGSSRRSACARLRRDIATTKRSTTAICARATRRTTREPCGPGSSARTSTRICACYPGDLAGARECLAGFEHHLSEAGIGTISEIFDAEEPFTPRGCIAQAWSVAEVLRAWLKTERARYPIRLQSALDLGFGTWELCVSSGRGLPESLDLLAVLRPVAGALCVDGALIVRLRFFGERGELRR